MFDSFSHLIFTCSSWTFCFLHLLYSGTFILCEMIPLVNLFQACLLSDIYSNLVFFGILSELIIWSIFEVNFCQGVYVTLKSSLKMTITQIIFNSFLILDLFCNYTRNIKSANVTVKSYGYKLWGDFALIQF